MTLAPKNRGFHLVTHEVLDNLPEIRNVAVGHLHLFIQHTSASLTINENADPDVRVDLEAWTRHTAADDTSYFVHTIEGPDDMPAHIKASLFGNSLQIPISDGRLALGTWQGIYLGEHRIHGGGRRIVATIFGENRQNP